MAVNAPIGGHDGRGLRRQLEQRGRARHHVDARRHHGGGVDQRGDRRGAFHGVRQPDVQRELRRFAGGADEEQQRDGAQHAEMPGLGVETGRSRSAAFTSRKRTVPNTAKVSSMPRMNAGVAHAVDDERLLARVAGRLLVEVEPDQQVAAQPHAFPADEQQRVVVRQHQHQHEEDEQVQIAEEPVVAVVVRHVAGGVDVDQEADAGDHQDHHGAERVEQEAPVGGEASPACPSAMWNGSPASQVNWITWWVRSGRRESCDDRARREAGRTAAPCPGRGG